MWWVRDATSWKQVTNPVVWDGTSFKAVVRGLVYDGTGWKRFWPDSELTTTQITSGLTGVVNIGVARTVSGTVTAVSGSVSGGTVTVQQRLVGGAWVNVGTATLGSGAIAPWSASVTPTECGATEFQAVYGGAGGYQGSTSALTAVTTTIQTPTKPTGGTITTSSLAFSWAAVPGATTYEVFRDGVSKAVQSALTYSDTGLAANTTYVYTVKAKKGTCASALSPALSGLTSQNAVTDVGSATIDIRPDKTNSYRPDSDWGYVGGDVAQGYYSSSGRNYTGCIDLGTNAQLRAKVEAELGANGAKRYDNMTVSAARVYLFKQTGVGSGGTVTVYFYNSTATAGSGGEPPRNGTAVASTSPSGGAGAWVSIGTAHWAALKAGTARSIVTYHLATTNYARFDGKDVGGSSSTRCNLQLDCAWNYQLSTAVVGKWT